MLDAVYLPPVGRGGEVIISTIGDQSIGYEVKALISATSGAAWPSANVGIFVPFTTPEPVTINKLWLGIATFAACNLDIGVFQEDGTRLVSMGTTALVNNSFNSFDITDTTLPRGRFYIGLTVDTVTAANFRNNNPAVGICQALGVIRDTSCAPPMSTNANPATFVATTHAYIPLMGLQGYRTVGP
jgi:hypothetical protein